MIISLDAKIMFFLELRRLRAYILLPFLFSLLILLTCMISYFLLI
jgi:hypothetical protein